MIKQLIELLRKSNDDCIECPGKDAEIARLRAALASKAIVTYPVVMPNQLHLADRIAYADKDRPWRTVTGTVVGFSWTSAGTFELILGAGWTWTDQISPSPKRPLGYYHTQRATSATKFELPGEKKLRLLARLDLS